MNRSARGWRRPAMGGLIVACLMMIATPAVAVAVAQEDYNLAVGLYQKERWADAAASFQRFIKANPDDPRLESALLYAGFALVNAGDYQSAREMFGQFVTKFPDSDRGADALYRLGETSYSLGDYERAEADLAAFLEKYPQHKLREWALPYLGDTQLHLKKYPAAEEHFRKSIKEFPKGALNSEAKFGLARSLEFQGKLEEALKTFAAIAQDGGPRAAASQMRVATIHYDAKRYDEAAEQFQELVRRFPESKFVSTARLNAGFSAYRAGEFEAAVQALEQAAESGSNPASANYWIGMARKAQGKQPEAAKAFAKVVTDFPESDFASESRFQWADSALRSGQTKEALRLYEEVASQMPPGEHTAAAVYFAGEAALMLDDVERAAGFVEQFETEHAESPYRMHAKLLAGRVLERQAAAEGIETDEQAALEEQALAKYESVLEETQVDSTEAKARFQVARLRERRGEYQESLTALEPLIKTIVEGGGDSPHRDALILAARDYLALEKFDEASEAASDYLKIAPDGAEATAALAARATARLANQEAAKAKDDWEQLKQREKGQIDELLPIARTLAERAYASEQWTAAADYFKEVVALAGDQPEGAIGLSGLGWSLHKAGKNQDASKAFGELLTRYPTAPRLAPEAAYMKGKTLQDAGELDAAAKAYRSAFETFAPEPPAKPGVEANPPERNIYLSGLQLARVLRLEDKTAEADTAYAALLKAFPQPANLDKLLEEWALLHYEAGDYKQADALFGRIVTETPDSPRAASARLSLAESAMINGDFEKAAADAKAIAEDESVAEETRGRAMSLLTSLAAEQGNWKRVMERSEKYLEQFPEGGERGVVMYLQGEALLQTGKPRGAGERLAQVAELGDEAGVKTETWFPRVTLLLAEVGFQEEDYDAARKRLDEFQAIEPAPKYAYVADELRGRIFKQQAKFKEARDAYQRVLNNEAARRTETAARSQYGIAETYFLQQNWEKARFEALRVYTLYQFPAWQAPALLMVGLSEEMMGQPKKAAKTFTDLTEEFPESPEADKAREKLKIATD